MIDTLKMKLNTFTPFKTHNKDYSEFVIKETRARKVAVLKRAAKAANADQRKMVKEAKQLAKQNS